MGASVGGSKAKSKNNSGFNFNQNIPAFQQGALTDLYGNAQNLFNSTNSNIQNQAGNIANTNSDIQQSTLPALNSALSGGVFSDPVFKNQLVTSLNNSLSSPSNTQQIYADIMGGNGNNYADAMKASYTADANRATANMLNNLDARASAAGMSGGSRQGIAQAQGLYDINSNLQKNLAETGYNTFDKDLTNKLNIAQQADTNTLSRQQMLTDMLGQSQSTSNNAISNLAPSVQNLGMGTLAPFTVPWDALNGYATAVSAPTVLSNSLGRSNGSSSSKGQSASVGLK